MRLLPTLTASALLAITIQMTLPAIATAAEDTHSAIAWRKDNDVDAAFALAKASKKPVFLYWGAVWCPPCNQVKATIFPRQDFIEKSRHFIPVYLDGDTPNAQKLAERFKVRGYPTMILFKPDGTEITRLPGEVDAERYLQVLNTALNANASVQESLKQALAGKKISADDWSLLADYSWDDPEQKLIPAKDVVPTLRKLATLSPQTASAGRLQFKSLVIAAINDPVIKLPAAEQNKAAAQLLAWLSDDATTRANVDLLSLAPAEVVTSLDNVKADQRNKVIEAWNAALAKASADNRLSKTDRLNAIAAQVALAKVDGKPDAGLQKSVQTRISQIEQATTDGYERQSVVSIAAHALFDAGLTRESDALLKAELKRSHSPYYFMSSLGSNAKKRGDKVNAVNWYEQAYTASTGPATRLQWGSNYLINLAELTPDDEARISKVAQAYFDEVATTENAFYERNRAYLQKLAQSLLTWNKANKHSAALQKIRTQINGICGKLPAQDQQRSVCQNLFVAKK